MQTIAVTTRSARLYIMIAAIALTLFPTLLAAQMDGQSVLLNNDWKFHQGDIDSGAVVQLDDSRWRTVNLPHDWSVENPLSPSLASATGYLPGGLGWYRKQIHIPAERRGQRLYIYFEGVYNNSEVFVNGHSIGKRPNGYVSFQYDLSDDVEFGAENVIAVKVDHSRYADSRWYTGSGIYRNVYLTYTNPIHIDLWGVSYVAKEVKPNQANLAIATKVKNVTEVKTEVTVAHELFLKGSETSLAKVEKKQTVAESSIIDVTQEMRVLTPKLWSVDDPNLYTLRTTVIQRGKVIDETSTTVGIRTLTFDANKGFALNGEWMKLKGVCIHHDAGVLGAAVPRQVWERRLKTLKTMGCNAIRMSHNPQASDVYDLCDELGLLVMDEAFDEWRHPKRKWLEGWNVGTPGFDGYAPHFEEWGEADLRDMVLRDRNHPSIILWSIGNEVDYPNDPYSHPVLDGATIGQKVYGGYQPERPDAMELGEIARRLVAVVKAHDTSRPVTAALAGVVMSNFTGYPEALDVAGYNYTENRYEEDHLAYPERIIYGSENRHDLNAWKAVRDNDYIFGQFLWTGIDYLGESGPWPSRGFHSGLLDFGGFIKPRGYYRQSLWTDQPMVYIGTHPLRRRGSQRTSIDAWPIWNYNSGDTIRVVSYTNCSDVQLFLDGQRLDIKANRDDENGVFYWDLPYQPGTLEGVAFRNGREVARHAIQTSRRPFKLNAYADRSVLSPGRDIAHMIIEVIDENGVPVMIADDLITCEIEGPAKLLGLESSNNTDMSDYTDHVHRAYHGRLLAYIETTGRTGKVKVKYSSPWLKPIEVELEVR
ncbi:sugar-binding domain-containing protein [Parapedobacter tibetensis]|uniref:sugar-binding domain-containing protein n=1 Tax=Parapedobacter tibetensis TaxID=2972951 RepID=UPI00214D96FE|nr:sugar-binding domain-containing protein [Parapedobacter tibetensis]